jgi:hypothetical protein
MVNPCGGDDDDDGNGFVLAERSENLQEAFGDEVPRKPFSEKGAKLDHPKANNGSTPACLVQAALQILDMHINKLL